MSGWTWNWNFAGSKRKHDDDSSSDGGKENNDEDAKGEAVEVAGYSSTTSLQIVDDRVVVENIMQTSADVIGIERKNFNSRDATLHQLLTKLIKDADITCPNVIVVGQQSSGKTKMIISMVFHHLIDNEYVTDMMGEKLLSIFRTGEKMVTRRPTLIRLKKADETTTAVANVTLLLGNKVGDINDASFGDIVTAIKVESSNSDRNAYMGELIIEITAPGLPNISFTDLPGLITENRTLSDCSSEYGQSIGIRQLVELYMVRKNTTLVVVEPASVEDFETSQISPLLRTLSASKRKDIFSNSILVLSKCDKIKLGLEKKIMQLINLKSRQIKDFPYKYIVGVVNKMEIDDDIDNNNNMNDEEESNDDKNTEGTINYTEFKETFKKTKDYERAIFENYKFQDGVTINRNTQCTTTSVFYQMDCISFNMIQRSIESGIESIAKQLDKIEFEIRTTLAPPLSFYDTDDVDTDQLPQQQNQKPQQGYHDIPTSRRHVFIDHLQDTFSNLLVDRFKEFSILNRNKMLFDIDEWPDFVLGDMQVSKKQGKLINLLLSKFKSFIESDIIKVVINIVQDPVDGCLSAKYSPFHRVDRFSLLCNEIRESILRQIPDSVDTAKKHISDYLKNVWNFDIPKGIIGCQRIPEVFNQLLQIAIRTIYDISLQSIDIQQLQYLLHDNHLFVENQEFIELRETYQKRWHELMNQKAILASCKDQPSNENVRTILQAAYERQSQSDIHQSTEENLSWNQFWKQAEDNYHKFGNSNINDNDVSVTDQPPTIGRDYADAADDVDGYNQDGIYEEKNYLDDENISYTQSIRFAKTHNVPTLNNTNTKFVTSKVDDNDYYECYMDDQLMKTNDLEYLSPESLNKNDKINNDNANDDENNDSNNCYDMDFKKDEENNQNFDDNDEEVDDNDEEVDDNGEEVHDNGEEVHDHDEEDDDDDDYGDDEEKYIPTSQLRAAPHELSKRAKQVSQDLPSYSKYTNRFGLSLPSPPSSSSQQSNHVNNSNRNKSCLPSNEKDLADKSNLTQSEDAMDDVNNDKFSTWFATLAEKKATLSQQSSPHQSQQQQQQQRQEISQFHYESRRSPPTMIITSKSSTGKVPKKRTKLDSNQYDHHRNMDDCNHFANASIHLQSPVYTSQTSANASNHSSTEAEITKTTTNNTVTNSMSNKYYNSLKNSVSSPLKSSFQYINDKLSTLSQPNTILPSAASSSMMIQSVPPVTTPSVNVEQTKAFSVIKIKRDDERVPSSSSISMNSWLDKACDERKNDIVDLTD